MVCAKCKVDKDEEEFHNSTAKGKFPWCKVCRKGYDKSYHQKYNSTRRVLLKVKHTQDLNWLWDLKKGPCTDCGNYFHPVIMQWDHLPGFEKRYAVSDMIRQHLSRVNILKEIAKCELVCANCHALRTYTRRSVA